MDGIWLLARGYVDECVRGLQAELASGTLTLEERFLRARLLRRALELHGNVRAAHEVADAERRLLEAVDTPAHTIIVRQSLTSFHIRTGRPHLAVELADEALEYHRAWRDDFVGATRGIVGAYARKAAITRVDALLNLDRYDDALAALEEADAPNTPWGAQQRARLAYFERCHGITPSTPRTDLEWLDAVDREGDFTADARGEAEWSHYEFRLVTGGILCARSAKGYWEHPNRAEDRSRIQRAVTNRLRAVCVDDPARSAEATRLAAWTEQQFGLAWPWYRDALPFVS